MTKRFWGFKRPQEPLVSGFRRAFCHSLPIMLPNTCWQFTKPSPFASLMSLSAEVVSENNTFPPP